MKNLDPAILRSHKGISFTGIGTAFICHDGAGKFLMSKRSKTSRDEPGRWVIPGGGLKWGVTAEENVRREIAEELCADVNHIEFLGYRDVFRKNEYGTETHWLLLDFLVLIDPDQAKNGEPEQCDEIDWFTLEQQPAPLHSQHKKLIKKYRSRLDEILKSR